MDFVHDIDFVPELGGSEVYLIAQVANVVYAAVGCGVNLDEIERPTFVDRDAPVAGVVGLAVGGVETVHGLGEDARGARLARAARAAEQVGVSQPAGGYGVSESVGHRVLTDYLVESARTPLSVQDFCHCPLSN